MNRRFFITTFLFSFAALLFAFTPGFAQRPEKGGIEWFDRIDKNRNAQVDLEEYKSAVADIFTKMDRNNDGVIDVNEHPRPPMPDGRGAQMNGRPDGNRPPVDGRRPGPDGPRGDRPKPIPFFIIETLREQGNLTRAQFDGRAAEQFRLMDKNDDGAVQMPEAEVRFGEIDVRVRSERRRDDFRPLDSSTARFIGAEMRFGEKLIKGAPFSAEIVIEDIRRLYDGSTVTKQSKGSVYRDGAGRTRREQPIDSIGGFSVVGEDGAPQKLVFINDFVANFHYFLDPNRKIARRDNLPDGRSPLAEKEPRDAKVESLGTKSIEGLNVTGTRSTFEIPVGQIGNDKPIAVVTEKWFSAELQLVVYSRHVDPLSGEHIFKLVNIRKGEPAAELFTVPTDYKIEQMRRR